MKRVGMCFDKDALIYNITQNYMDYVDVDKIDFDRFMKMIQDNFVRDPILPNLILNIILSTLDDYLCEEIKNEKKYRKENEYVGNG